MSCDELGMLPKVSRVGGILKLAFLGTPHPLPGNSH
jgi:hypothetical protein